MVPFSKILECLTEAPMRAVQIAVRCEAEVAVVHDVCAELISRNWIGRDEEAFYFLPKPAVLH